MIAATTANGDNEQRKMHFHGLGRTLRNFSFFLFRPFLCFYLHFSLFTRFLHFFPGVSCLALSCNGLTFLSSKGPAWPCLALQLSFFPFKSIFLTRIDGTGWQLVGAGGTYHTVDG